MRRTFFLLCAISIGWLLSSFRNNLVSVNYSKGQLLLTQITNLKSHEEQRLGFTLLSANDKYLLWNSRLENILESGKCNKEQFKAIENLQSALSIAVFQKTDAREVFNNVWFPNWVKENANILSSVQIFNATMTLSGNAFAEQRRTSLALTLNMEGSENESAQTCKCAVGSNFTCPKYGWEGGPVISWGKCTKANHEKCVVVTRGCGAFMDSDCDGSICDNS